MILVDYKKLLYRKQIRQAASVHAVTIMKVRCYQNRWALPKDESRELIPRRNGRQILKAFEIYFSWTLHSNHSHNHIHQ